MKKKQQSPIWPYLCILACLFVLSVTAPRAWERMARRENLSQLLAARPPRETTADRKPAGDTSTQGAAPANRPDPTPQAASESADIEVPTAIAEGVSPPVTEFASELQPLTEPAADDAPDSTQAEAESQPAVVAPLPITASPAPAIQEQPALVESRWPLPGVLLEQLQEVAREDSSAAWAARSIALIHELCQSASPEARPAARVLADLKQVAEQGTSAGPSSSTQQARTVRTRYALTRWLTIWEGALDLDSATTRTADEGADERIATRLAAVEALLRQGATGPAWRTYLALDDLMRLQDATDETSQLERRAIARKVLDRIASPYLTQPQETFVAQEPIAAFERALRAWAVEPVPVARLLADMDRYERSGLPSDARQLVQDYRALNWASSSESQAVGKQLNTHYRNANIRVAISRELFNLLIPQPNAVEAPFRDTVVDVPVNGRNITITELSVRLVPDDRRIRLGLEAWGLVTSNAVSTSGPATFRSKGQSTFLVQKLLVLGPDGLSIWPAVATAENNFNNLVELETNYDRVPLVGSLVRGIARSQHDEKQHEARLEVEQKVATRARDQLDAEVRPRLVEAAERLEKKQIATLRRLGLELVPVGLSTTEERAVARARLGSPEQAGAHTPRPRAPSDSWLSMQIHQSALNNGLEQLGLDGREFTLDELFAWIARKLNRPELAKQEDLPEDVRLKFAAKNSVRVNCEHNRVEILLSFSELKQGSRRWRDFTVRAYYRPEAQGLSPVFTRDSAISVDAKGLKARPHLYAIFSKVLSRERDLRLLDESITSDPRLQSLAISQYIVDHGWIGLAYSPARRPPDTALRPK